MIPDKPGTYLVKCDESDGEWSTVKVYRKNGMLLVDCPDIGRGYLVEHYHNGLTDIEWKLIGW